jgi:TonB family protein
MTAAVPAKPLDIQDTDYPFGSLLTNEEGKIQINLTVNARGQVTDARMLTPTKLSRLEEQAAAIARSRWQFKPAMRNRQAVESQLNVDVDWKLPMQQADDVYSKMMGIPVNGKNVVGPKFVSRNKPAAIADYPTAAANVPQLGEVAMQLRILKDGSVGEAKVIDSSGNARLDQWAIANAKDMYVFEPGTIDGMPAEMSTQLLDLLVVDRTIVKNPPERFCHSTPIIGAATGMTSEGQEAIVDVTEWVHVVRSGAVDDGLLNSDAGWKRYSPGLLLKVGAAQKVQDNLIAQAAPKIGSLMSAPRRPASCWYRNERALLEQ